MRKILGMAAAIGVAAAALSGCGASVQDQADDLCASVDAQLTGELAMGDKLTEEDLVHLPKRVSLAEKLYEDLTQLDQPDSNWHKGTFEDLKAAVDQYARSVAQADYTLRHVQPNATVMRSMAMNKTWDDAKTVGRRAEAFGANACSGAGQWEQVAAE